MFELRHQEGKLELRKHGAWTRIAVKGPRGGEWGNFDLLEGDLKAFSNALHNKATLCLQSTESEFYDNLITLVPDNDKMHLTRRIDRGRGEWFGATLSFLECDQLADALLPEENSEPDHLAELLAS